MTAALLTAAPYLRWGLMDVPLLVALTAAVLTDDGRFADGRPLPSVGADGRATVGGSDGRCADG